MRVFKKIVLGLLIVFALLQFIPGDVNKSEQISSSDITNNYTVPAEVQSIFKKACYDCHSNNTHYPWYSRVQPFRYMMDRHVRNGKDELNFSEYGSYSKKKQFNKLNSIAESIEKGTMPLNSYILMHADAKLGDTEKRALLEWTDSTRNKIKLKNR